MDAADLVVGIDDGDGGHIGADAVCKDLGVDESEPVDGKQFELEIVNRFQLFGGVEDRWMLHGAGENAVGITLLASCKGCAAQSQVIALRAASGKDDLFRSAVQRLGNLLPGGIYRLLGMQTPTMMGRRVAEMLHEIGLHGLKDAGIHGCCGGVIQVDALGRHGGIF